MKTAIEEYFETKQAMGSQLSLKGMAGNAMSRLPGMVGNAAMGAASGALVGAGAAGLSAAASKIYDAITKRRDFHAMLEHNPDLKEHLETNPKLFNQAYSSLRAVSPTFGQDPLIAGSFMRQVMDAPEGAGNHLRVAFSDAQRRHDPMADLYGKGAIEGTKSGLGKR